MIGAFSLIDVQTVENSDVIDSKSDGATSANTSGILSRSTGASSLNAEPIPLIPSVMAGSRLSKAISALSTTSSSSAPMSASGLANPATRLVHAPFTIFREPSIVLDASLDVVPAMFCFCWIRSMAVTISAKLSIDRSAACPVAFPYSFASLIRRSISVFVPP